MPSFECLKSCQCHVESVPCWDLVNELTLGGARRRTAQANCTPIPGWVRQLRGIRAGRCTSKDAAGDIAEIGLPFPTLLAVLAGLVEIVCGSFLALGRWTEWAAAGLLLFLVPVTVRMEPATRGRRLRCDRRFPEESRHHGRPPARQPHGRAPARQPRGAPQGPNHRPREPGMTIKVSDLRRCCRRPGRVARPPSGGEPADPSRRSDSASVAHACRPTTYLVFASHALAIPPAAGDGGWQ